MLRVFLATVVLALLGCTTSDEPDARTSRPQPIVPDGGASVDAAAAPIDAATGGSADAATAAADARPVDARPADAAMPTPDAAPPDAPVPMGPAELILNELSPDFVNGRDLVELLVVGSGTTDGIQLEKDYPRAPVILATLPDVIVYEGQLVVVHLMPAGTTAMAESVSVDEHDTLHNFDGAWDFLGAAQQIPYSNVILSLRDADGHVTSAVPFFRADLSEENDSFPRLFPADLQALIDDGLWEETCAPSPCSYGSNLSQVTVGWLGAGSTSDPDSAAGASVQRKTGTAGGRKVSDWRPVPSATPYNSYGAPNP